jgi:perosamine synthetase
VIRLPITRPDLGEAEIEAVARTIRSGWITQGPEVAAFETEFAAFVGAPHAVAMANCTVALELCLRALGVGPGDEVATVSHSFIATANAILAVGARPILVDVEADNYGLDPTRLERSLTLNTKAILAVHQIGIPCAIESIVRIGTARGIPVIEDAACAIGTEVLFAGEWRRVGQPFGIMACFSFHPRKILTTGDGGMITTADPNLERRLKLLRQHAMSVPDTIRHRSDRVMFEEYVEPAFNARLTDLQAAVGRPQLRRLEAAIERRRTLARGLTNALQNNRVLAPPVVRADARPNWQSYPTTLRPGCAATQVQVMQFLLDKGIATKRGIANSHQEPAYAQKGNWVMGDGGLSVSEHLRDHTVLLPLFQAMSDSEMEFLLGALRALDSEFVGVLAPAQTG